MVVVITWSPGFKTPFIPIFKLSVALKVRTIFIGFFILKSLHKDSLVSNIPRLALKASLCPDLPGFAPYSLMDVIIELYTISGLGNVVAPLSKYNISTLLPF